MMDITIWHRQARLYQNNELELADIVKQWIINTALHVIEDDVPFSQVGYNVLDNTRLHEVLFVGLIAAMPSGQGMSQTEMGEILGLNLRIVNGTVKRLVERGVIEKAGFGPAGYNYEIIDAPPIPRWIYEFTKALYELHTDEELRARVAAECDHIGFKRGFDALKEEIRQKYMPRKYRKQSG